MCALRWETPNPQVNDRHGIATAEDLERGEVRQRESDALAPQDELVDPKYLGVFHDLGRMNALALEPCQEIAIAFEVVSGYGQAPLRQILRLQHALSGSSLRTQ